MTAQFKTIYYGQFKRFFHICAYNTFIAKLDFSTLQKWKFQKWLSEDRTLKESTSNTIPIPAHANHLPDYIHQL
jgi:hypothetical protein